MNISSNRPVPAIGWGATASWSTAAACPAWSVRWPTLLNLRHGLQALEDAGLEDVQMCIETMGKINVLGDAEEVCRICRMDERLLPCIDFGHLNARTMGGMCREEDFAALLDLLHRQLGAERAKHFHAHFSKIEYGKGGEVKHLTFEDEAYGPDFAPKCLYYTNYGQLHEYMNAAQALQEKVLAEFPHARLILEPTRALCSFYAEAGGLIIGFEGSFNADNDNRKF